MGIGDLTYITLFLFPVSFGCLVQGQVGCSHQHRQPVLQRIGLGHLGAHGLRIRAGHEELLPGACKAWGGVAGAGIRDRSAWVTPEWLGPVVCACSSPPPTLQLSFYSLPGKSTKDCVTSIRHSGSARLRAQMLKSPSPSMHAVYTKDSGKKAYTVNLNK